MRGFGLLSLSAVAGVILVKSWNFGRVSKEVGLGGDERIFGEGCCCGRWSCCWRVDEGFIKDWVVAVWGEAEEGGLGT